MGKPSKINDARGRKPEHPEGRTEAIGVTVPHMLVKKARRYGKTKKLNLSQVVTEALRRLR